MGKNDFVRTLTGSDSGYGDDISERNSSSSLHPLSRKGYEIGPASKLHVGDVFEFLWADCPEFEWEWKCLGYTRFIVLRHSDSFPHYCACVPISIGSKCDFAKPGVDSLQQGYVYASGDKDHGRDGAATESSSQRHHAKSLPELAYSSVGISLRSGQRHRVKDDSRANYADVVEVDHEAQVMVIGDAARYFDRVRKNVNKAFMRQVLRDALGPYCQRKKSESAAAGKKGWGNSAASLVKVPAGEDKEGREPADHIADHIAARAAEEDGSSSSSRDRARGKEVEQARPEHELQQRSPRNPAGTDKDMEDLFSDTTRDEENWEGSPGSPQSPAYLLHHQHPHHHHHHHPSPPMPQHDDRRSRRAASGARASPVVAEHATGVRPGMDKAGLSSLRTLRQGLLGGGEEHDDTQSLRSLAMVGRSDSYSSSRSRR